MSSVPVSHGFDSPSFCIICGWVSDKSPSLCCVLLTGLHVWQGWGDPHQAAPIHGLQIHAETGMSAEDCAGLYRAPAWARGLIQRECGRVTQSELLPWSSLGLSSEMWLDCYPRSGSEALLSHLLWVGQGMGSSQMVPRAGSPPAFVLAAGGSNTSHPFPLSLSFFPLRSPRHLYFFPPRDAACALSFHKSKCILTAQFFFAEVRLIQ